MTEPTKNIHIAKMSFGNVHNGQKLNVPEGKSVAEIIRIAFPGYRDEDLRRVRVTLCKSERFMVIEHDRWEKVRPKAGTGVILNVVPGKGALKSILQIVVSIAAVAIGAYFGPMLFGAGLAGNVASGIIGLGAWPCGELLYNRLVPPAAFPRTS